MKMNDSTKRLILVLAIILSIALPIVLLIMPINDKIKATNAEIQTLEERYAYLSDLFSRINEFREKTKEYKEQIAEIVYKFPEDIQQENTIMFMVETERNLPISMYQVAFAPTDSTPIGTLASDLSETIESTEKLGQDFTGIHTTETIGYRVPYEDFKTFINYIEQWEDRMTFSNLTASYSAEANEVAGSFTINQYAIQNDGFVLEEAETNVENGTHNIFVADDEQWEDWMDEEESSMNQSEIIEDEKSENKPSKDKDTSDNKPSANAKGYDVYFMLNQPQSEADAMVVGYTNDTTGRDTLKSDDNLARLTRFVFTEENGKYYVTYKLSYRYEKHEITPGKDIVFNVYSCNRAGSDDEVESSMAIVNDTDKTVQVNILNDDKDSPRISIREKSGKLKINK